jgi:uncharacterized SAM-binding protein YcdF (DUF218 family)
LYRGIAEAVAAVIAILVVDLSLAGVYLFNNARMDELQHVDAIVVLGGEHDGREDYGLSLANDGWAPTVVLSNPYAPDDPVMKRVCRKTESIEVVCPSPFPLTTRGEAAMIRRLATQRSWTKIIVVSWRYHLPRARLVFRQCYSDQPGATVMREVPRQYHFSFVHWESIYAYQFAGIAKAVFAGDCA